MVTAALFCARRPFLWTPTTVNRLGNGGTVSFNFTSNPPTNSFVDPGDCTADLIIATNATQFTAGTISFLDGIPGGPFAGFAPIPGPILGAGLPGLMIALGGVVGLARRRRAHALTA